MVSMPHLKTLVNAGLIDLKMAILAWQTKNVENHLKNLMMLNEFLKPGETVNTDRYKQQLINLNRVLLEKRPEYQRRQHKVIFLHDNAPAHTAKPVKKLLSAMSWEVLSHAAYSSDLALSDFHLFRSMAHGLAKQQFKTYEEVKIWLDSWFSSKEEKFFWDGIHNLPKRWEKCVASDGAYFE